MLVSRNLTFSLFPDAAHLAKIAVQNYFETKTPHSPLDYPINFRQKFENMDRDTQTAKQIHSFFHICSPVELIYI